MWPVFGLNNIIFDKLTIFLLTNNNSSQNTVFFIKLFNKPTKISLFYKFNKIGSL